MELISAPLTRTPKSTVPLNACDTHGHVFGPLGRFPLIHQPIYSLPLATGETYRAHLRSLGMARGILTQPTPYGKDPSAMLAVLASAPDAIRGVAVADAETEPRILERWRASGVVGLRFVQIRTPDGLPYPGSVSFDHLEVLAPVMRSLNMHAQLWAKAEDLVTELPRLLRFGVRLVLDHMGSPDPNGVAFSKLLSFLRAEDIWTKLVVCRLGVHPNYSIARPLHDALIDVAPERCLWGTDWPYVRMSQAPDAAQLLDMFFSWTRSDEIRHRILVENPARLYGFPR